MTKERAWPTKAMYILVAVAMAMSLILTGAFTGKVSADPDMSEWTRVTTPTTDDWLLAPETDIIDYALGDGGDVAYAIVDGWNEEEDTYGSWLLKSDDGAATWEDITDALDEVIDPDDEDYNYIDDLLSVATDWEDAEFVAVALLWWDNDAALYYLHVFVSDDGGATFEDAGEVEDGVYLSDVADLAVSVEVDGARDIAIGGYDSDGYSALFRCTVTGDAAGAWEDATDYDGWDDNGAITSSYVVDILFAPSWAADKTILVLTAGDFVGSDDGWLQGDVHLQCGSWGTSEGWNADSVLAIDAVRIKNDVWLPVYGVGSFDYRGIGGITAPLDYAGRNSDKRYVWVWVNYWANGADAPQGEIIRVRNTSILSVNQQIEDMPWLTNVSYLGYIAEGKAIAGVLGTGMMDFFYDWSDLVKDCCEGVDVYRNTQITNMDICCLPWEVACKPPTGTTGMAVSYVSADKAYAVALGPAIDGYDESAWSVSFDYGDVWNQLSLVDTDIHYFSDVAVSPDCNKTWVVAINDNGESCGCDSVWLHAVEFPEEGYSEYSDHWLRVWCGSLEGLDDDDYEHGILRLNPEETTGDTVYLADLGSDNVYWNELEGLACWDFGSASVDAIADLAVLDKETIYALDYDGTVGMSDDFAIGWHEAVDSELDEGWTLAVWDEFVLVGGQDGDVSYADTSEADDWEDVTFTALEDIADSGYVTVAFDTYFDTNSVIYAALAWCDDETDNGIYRFVIDESESWTDLGAEPLESQVGVSDGDAEDEIIEVDFTGLVVDRPGNPFTDAENGGVIYASYEFDYTDVDAGYGWSTGAARSLFREVTVCTTCLDWDFLHVGLTVNVEDFYAYPDALKICGCLTPDSNTKLFAVDWGDDYDMYDGEEGTVWTFEDCYAKKAPEPTDPDVKADPCSCYSAPFSLVWDPLCDACYYEIQFALDEDFTMLVGVNGLTPEELAFQEIQGDNPAFSVMGGLAGGLSCERTYYWRVRASKAATGQVIHSWWSDGSFTVPPSIEAAQIELVSPVPGAQDQPTRNVGFSWDLLAEADTFNWVLSKNANLSAPIESKPGLTSTAYATTQTLEHGTTYYWQVTAYKDDAIVGVSAIGTFTTSPMGPFCAQDGVCFDTQQELEDYNAEHFPAQPATPFWVWIVIAIGAVLVIVVIVLIFRTRRV